MNTTLITGASGFLGTALMAEFAAAQHPVIGVDRNAPQSGAQKDARAVRQLVCDIGDPGFAALVAESQPHTIIHAAGPASVQASLVDPAGDFRAAVLPLLNLLDAVRLSRVPARVVLISSAAVYGEPKTLPVREDAPPAPISPYGFHKRACERLLEEYHRIYGIPGSSVRIFSAYGEGLRRQVLWDLARKMLSGEAVTLHGTGEETRDFIHASDVARGVRAVTDRGSFHAETYNLASGTATSMGDLARALADALRCDAEIRFNGIRRPGDPVHWRADIERIEALGFSPRMNLDAGVRKYAAWVREAVRSLEPAHS